MSDSDDERADEEWNYRARHETETQRLEHNWAALLQELRVVQTGVQLLTGFLLTLPFQQRFVDLTDFEVGVYLVTVALSVLSTMLLVAPAGIHRALFRQHALPALVSTAHKLTVCGIATLGGALVGVVLLIFSFVVSPKYCESRSIRNAVPQSQDRGQQGQPAEDDRCYLHGGPRAQSATVPIVSGIAQKDARDRARPTAPHRSRIPDGCP